MRYLVTNDQMKQADAYTICELGIPSLILMERAAWAAAEEILARARPGDRVWVACGLGNNGADGIAVARILFIKGLSVVLVTASEEDEGRTSTARTEEYELQRRIAGKLDICCLPFEELSNGAVDSCDILVDAVFGVGLSRIVNGRYGDFIRFLNDVQARLRVALDIPSGISGDTGQVMGRAARADLTVTFGWEKRGTALYPGREYAGQVLVKDIGFPESAVIRQNPDVYTYGPEDLERILPRPAYSNKGTFGKVLVIAGASGMSGAAYLSALAAYRAGAGLAKILTVEENRTILQTGLPEAIIETYASDLILQDGRQEFAWLKQQCAWADSIVLGPGLGRLPYVKELVQGALCHARVPVVVDADALNTIAANPQLTGYYTERTLITPHLGEMSRLTGQPVDELRRDLLKSAGTYSRQWGVTTVLKDAATVVADPDDTCYINDSGNSVLAVAGSGDVLAGLIAGLLAQGMDIGESARMGVYIHGLAGDAAASDRGNRGLLASELAGYIPKVMGRNKRSMEA